MRHTDVCLHPSVPFAMHPVQKRGKTRLFLDRIVSFHGTFSILWIL